ncbi:MAG: GNAT family N-acetyltransferase, partial [Defluviitaleaceae bacterium]|nr:GNAT family N-acetyltransferase [Defluviitaleaceae bacterium]
MMPAHEMITISTSEYLTHELVEKITAMQWNSTSPECINRIRRMVYGDKYDSDCFNVLAYNETGDVVGRMYCAKNQENPKRWYYGDLAVKPSYRRMKIATKMIKSAIEKISDMGGDTICCYVEPSNTASIGLQKQFGFVEKPTMPFNLLIVDGEIMFEYGIGQIYNVIPTTADEAYFV